MTMTRWLLGVVLLMCLVHHLTAIKFTSKKVIKYRRPAPSIKVTHRTLPTFIRKSSPHHITIKNKPVRVYKFDKPFRASKPDFDGTGTLNNGFYPIPRPSHIGGHTIQYNTYHPPTNHETPEKFENYHAKFAQIQAQHAMPMPSEFDLPPPATYISPDFSHHEHHILHDQGQAYSYHNVQSGPVVW